MELLNSKQYSSDKNSVKCFFENAAWNRKPLDWSNILKKIRHFSPTKISLRKCLMLAMVKAKYKNGGS